jgi:tRNA G18 (ribose-2'-O)-methylase SpoU
MPAMVVTRLDDRNDDLLADYRGVPDPLLAARRGVFVAEGRLVVRRLLTESPLRTRSVMLTETAYRSLEEVLAQRPDLPVYVVPQQVMDGITGFNIHRGCLALGERPEAIDWRTLVDDRGPKGPPLRTQPPRLTVLERIGNADNVGSIFRSAAAFGADAVLLGPACADPLYRKAIRTSMGAVLSMPFAAATPWPGALCELRERAYASVALTPSPRAAPLSDVAAAVHGRPVAIVLGHEGDGLTPEAMAACDLHARIPLRPGTDSLNVAVAASIALYELAR